MIYKGYEITRSGSPCGKWFVWCGKFGEYFQTIQEARRYVEKVLHGK